MSCGEYDRLRTQVKAARDSYVLAVATVDRRVPKVESRRTVERVQAAVTQAEELFANHVRTCPDCQNETLQAGS